MQRPTKSRRDVSERGEKAGWPHRNPNDPPRCRANKSWGRGTYKNDRLPIVGVVDWETKQSLFEVCPDTKEETIQAVLAEETEREACIFTDENRSYFWLENEEEPRARNATDPSAAWTETAIGRST